MQDQQQQAAAQQQAQQEQQAQQQQSSTDSTVEQATISEAEDTGEQPRQGGQLDVAFFASVSNFDRTPTPTAVTGSPSSRSCTTGCSTTTTAGAPSR